MQTLDVVRDSLGRVHELVPAILDGLTPADLLWRPDPEANSIGWLMWHLTRVEDDHLAEIGGVEQAWTAQGWYPRFGLPYLRKAHGFRMTPVEVGAFSLTEPHLLGDYAAATWAQTVAILDAMPAERLDEVIDASYTPPVTVGMRLVSVMVETAQHIGQAGFVRGMRERTLGVSSGWAGTA